jgi:stage V sporulation protein AA
MSDILYLKAEKSMITNKTVLTIGDVAKIECANTSILNKIKQIQIIELSDKNESKYVVSILKVIERIHEVFPQLEINNIGEPDFVIEYYISKHHKILEYIKIFLIGIILFVGAAFTIMTFNNDVAVEKLFAHFYQLIMNKESSGFTILEMSYSIGLGVGILVFYNHIGGKRINTDPTPIQVEMRIYEDEVNTALVKNYTREDKRIDVN